MEQYRRLVYSMVHKKSSAGQAIGVGQDELVSAAWLGVCEAHKGYDASLNVPLSSWVSLRICWALSAELRKGFRAHFSGVEISSDQTSAVVDSEKHQQVKGVSSKVRQRLGERAWNALYLVYGVGLPLKTVFPEQSKATASRQVNRDLQRAGKGNGSRKVTGAFNKERSN